jgi:hypothetical protein
MKTNLKKTLEACEKEIEKKGNRKLARNKQYSEILKKNVISFITLGGKKAILIERLEIDRSTINRWLREKPNDKKLFKEIQVVSKNKNLNANASHFQRNIILQTSSGCSVQFENLQDLASVLRLIS